MTHICASKLTTIGSDNGLSPGRRQAMIWNNAVILLIGPLGTNFTGIVIEIHTFSFKKIHLKMSSGKWRPFCLGLNVLNYCNASNCYCFWCKTNLVTKYRNFWLTESSNTFTRWWSLYILFWMTSSDQQKWLQIIERQSLMMRWLFFYSAVLLAGISRLEI